MLDIHIDRNNRYRADDLYQWDTRVVLNIYGLSLPSAPEIHFDNGYSKGATVKLSTMDERGVVSTTIPDVLLQSFGNLKLYICCHCDNNEFRTLYELTLKINRRPKPTDYIIVDEEAKIYSFNALESLVNSTVIRLERENTELHNQIIGDVNDIVNQHSTEINEVVNHAVGLVMGTKGHTVTFKEDGSILISYEDGTSELTTFLADGGIKTVYDWGDQGVRTSMTRFNEDGTITVTFEQEV